MHDDLETTLLARVVTPLSRLNYKMRFVMLEAGVLMYYKAAADHAAGKPPLKDAKCVLLLLFFFFRPTGVNTTSPTEKKR